MSYLQFLYVGTNRNHGTRALKEDIKPRCLATMAPIEVVDIVPYVEWLVTHLGLSTKY